MQLHSPAKHPCLPPSLPPLTTLSDYLMHFHLKEAQMENKLVNDGVRLYLYAGAFEGDHLL